MITIIQLQDAIHRLYGLEPPNKIVKLSSIRSMIACYLCVPIEQISIMDLKLALRNTDFALPKPKLRTKPGAEPQIDWFFIRKEAEKKTLPTTPTKKKQRNYKEKPLTSSMRMKAS